MNVQQKFGIVIRRLRRDRGISQEKLSLEANIDRTYMSDIEKGHRNISLEIMFRIASSLKIPLSELLKKVEQYEGSE